LGAAAWFRYAADLDKLGKSQLLNPWVELVETSAVPGAY
jgi:hypothetical protein